MDMRQPTSWAHLLGQRVPFLALGQPLAVLTGRGVVGTAGQVGPSQAM